MSKGRKSFNIYCIHCGEENSKKDKRCKKCHRKLNGKEIMFFPFIGGQIKNYLVDEATGSLFDNITSFLIHYSFGIILTMSVAFVGVTTVVNYISNDDLKDHVTVVDKKVEIINKCLFSDVSDMIYKCNDGYTLTSDNKCEKVITLNAKETKVCASGYTLSNNQCVSVESTPITETEVCEVPNNYSHKDSFFGNITKDNIIKVTLKTNSNNKKYCSVKWCEDLSFVDWGIMECLGNVQSGAYADDTLLKIKKSCPEGMKEISGVCKKTASVKKEYSCDKGELSGKKCLSTEVKEALYTCPDNYKYNEECQVCVGGNNE